MDDSIQTLVDSTVKMMGLAADAMIKKGVLKRYARIARVYYDELKREGFTDEVATKIVANFNFGIK